MNQPATAVVSTPIDTITILECAEGHRATKRIYLGPGERGAIVDGYDAGTWFTARSVPLDGPDDLFRVLEETSRNPRAFVIRGDLHERWKQSEEVRRTSQPRYGMEPSFVARPRRWLALDFDRVPTPPCTDVTIDPHDAVRELIERYLPEAFHGARCWFQFTSGQGFKGDTLNARLWFWLTEPTGDAELRAWARGLECVDPALYSAVEPHYIAAPILGPGVHDPVPVRSGVHCGDGADAVLLHLPPAPAYTGLGDRRERAGDGVGGYEHDELAELLSHVPNADLPYDEWLAIGAKVKAAAGADGEGAFVDWSSQSGKFNEREARAKFRSLNGAGGEHGLYLLAREGGYDPWRGEVFDLLKFRANVEARQKAAPGNGVVESNDEARARWRAAANISFRAKAAANGNAPALVCPAPFTDEAWTMPDPMQGEVEEPTEAAPGALPEPAGLVRIIRDHIIETSKYPQPELALVAALTIVGTAAARRYSFDGNVRPNTYFLGVAPSASGKNAPLEAVERILEDSGFGEALAGGEPSSGSAVASRLLSVGTGQHAGVAVYVIDEFGMLLRAMTGEKSPPHVREIVKALTVVYTKSAGRYAGKDFADRQDRPTRVVQQPHLSLFGVTAGTHVWKGITPESIADGSIARFMVVEAANPFPSYNRAARPPVTPQEVKDALRRIHACGGNPGAGNLAGVSLEAPPNLREMKVAPTAAALFDAAVDRETELKRQHFDAGLSAVYGRWVEQSKKLAMIHALSRDAEHALIDEGDARFGLDLALVLIERFVAAIGKNVTRNEWEGHSNAILDMIKAAGRKGVAQNEITRRTQHLKSRDRHELLGGLEEAGRAEFKTEKTRGRERVVWFYVKPS